MTQDESQNAGQNPAEDEAGGSPSPYEGEGRGEVSDLEAKCAEYLSGWKRALADYENLQKQNAQARDDDRRRVRSNLAEDLLPVVDNFGYVMKHAPNLDGCSDEFKKKFDTWFQGIGHIERQFAEAMKNMGVEPIASVGTLFDPNLHESGGSRSEPGKKEHEIVEELIKGWKIGDVVLRPAKVIVNE